MQVGRKDAEAVQLQTQRAVEYLDQPQQRDKGRNDQARLSQAGVHAAIVTQSQQGEHGASGCPE